MSEEKSRKADVFFFLTQERAEFVKNVFRKFPQLMAVKENFGLFADNLEAFKDELMKAGVKKEEIGVLRLILQGKHPPQDKLIIHQKNGIKRVEDGKYTLG